jgi:AcrR family transcriptional regulator
MARKTKEEAEKTRRQLLDAGLRLFATKGFAETSVEEVAGEAGLSKGAVYWHFDSKAALLRGILEDRRDSFRARVRKCDFDSATRDSFLDGMVRWAENIVGTEEHRMFFILMGTKVDWNDKEIRPVREWILREEFGPAYVVRHALASFAARGMIPADYDETMSIHMLLGLWHGLLRGRLMGVAFGDFKDCIRLGLDAILTSIEQGKVKKTARDTPAAEEKR